MSSMILYHGEPNGPSLSALAALFESGVAAETRHMDLPGGERHNIAGVTEPLARDMSVEGEGPVLVIDGEAMTESVFIAQFLDETGSGHLQPKDAYAHWQMLMWCRRITERCAPAAAFLGCQAYPAIGEVPDSIKSEDLKARWAQIAARDFPEAALDDSRTKIADAARLVEQQLSDGREWLMGDISIADFETYGWLAGMAEIMPDAFEGKSHLADWLQRVASRPSVAKALALATVPDPRKAWAPGQEINRWG